MGISTSFWSIWSVKKSALYAAKFAGRNCCRVGGAGPA